MVKEEKKIEILQAAGRVFYFKGYKGTKMEDVAREAGIGKGTVYEYFESKQQLFEEMVVYHRGNYLRSVQEIMDTEGSFKQNIIAFARYQTKFVMEHFKIYDKMACSKVIAREMGAIFLEQNIRVMEIIMKMVKEAVKRGELRPEVDPEIASAAIWGTVNLYCGQKALFIQGGPETINYDNLVDTILKGISR